MPPSPPFGCPNLQRTTAEVASRHIWGTPWDPWDGVGTLSSPHTCEPHDMHGLNQQPGRPTGVFSSTALPRPTGQHGLSTARKTPVPSRLTGHSLYHYGIDSLHMGLHVSRSGGPELLVVIKVGPVGVRSRRGRALDFSCLGAAVTVQTWGWGTSSSSWLHARREYISGWLPWPAGGPEGRSSLGSGL